MKKTQRNTLEIKEYVIGYRKCFCPKNHLYSGKKRGVLYNSNAKGMYILMLIKTKTEGNLCVAEILGELDHHTSEETKKKLDKLIAGRDVKNLVLDLHGLVFMDSSGIGVILGRYKQLKQRGGTVSVKNVNRQIDKVFNVSGLYSVIKKIN
jgi:stage II sporulation protein AA (anti-sigma F factor antagonist)